MVWKCGRYLVPQSVNYTHVVLLSVWVVVGSVGHRSLALMDVPHASRDHGAGYRQYTSDSSYHSIVSL